jgi:hypothetical protein
MFNYSIPNGNTFIEYYDIERTEVPSSITMYIGESTSIEVNIYPDQNLVSRIEYHSSLPEIANINSDGLIYANDYGQTEISVTPIVFIDGLETKTGKCIVNVFEHTEGIALPSTININIGDEIQLDAKTLPLGRSDNKILFESNDPSIANVTEKGLVTGNKQGTCTITATTVDGNYTAICTVNVISPQYKLTYIVDGEIYKTYEIEKGLTISSEPSPQKEGYTFSGWSEIPETMPANDVTITGTFTVNKYKLTYTVDGEEYNSSEIEYGTSITPLEEPAKEGYTFSGWSEIPKTMPAEDVTVTGSFSKGAFKLTYNVNGEEYKTYELDYGASITPLEEPTMEGYTFSGWSEIPETMPAEDITVTGTFTINKYKLTYTVDGEEYNCSEIEYGASITPLEEPAKEGYTFSDWSEIPETMPAEDVTITGTFTINSYMLTYLVDGEKYESYEIEYGASITPLEEPTKEGYTFSGWSEIPETMPAEDVTVTGSFSKGAFKLTYNVNGEEYKTYQLDYGASITPLEEPTKEGYTFSGWSYIPETMPAEDVTVTGTFTINSYKLTYTVDGEEYNSSEIEYGASITPIEEPAKEGYTFSGWSYIPSKMPAEDVTVTGSFSVNSYKLTYMIDNEVYKETTYEYGASIVPEPQPEGNYATFEWEGLPETMPAEDIVIHASYTTGIIDVLLNSQRNVRIYTPDGKKRDQLQKGLNIVVLDDGTIHKIVTK